LGWNGALCFCFASWQGEIKRGTQAHRAFSFDFAAVPVDDALDGRQPDAGAGKIGGAVQPLERAKQFVRVSHVEADAVVTQLGELFQIVAAINHAGVKEGGGFGQPAIPEPIWQSRRSGGVFCRVLWLFEKGFMASDS
jgi:hypothetical protein